MKRIYLLFIILAVGCVQTLWGQDHFTLTSKNLPQSMLTNPAMRPSRGFVSLPLIGSFTANVESSFSYNTIIDKNSNGVKYLNTQGLINATKGNDLTMMRLNLDLINTGFFVGRNDYVGVTLRARVHAASSMPGGVFEMILDNPITEYKTFDVSMTPNVMGWVEAGVSYTRDIDRNWQVGGRLKYLNGIASVHSTGMNVDVKKEYDRYVISGDYSLRGGNVNFAAGDPFENMFGNMTRNPGFAVDLGAVYVSDDDKISANVAVSDLGAIFWNAENSSVIKTNSGGLKYEFLGVNDLGGLIDGSSSIASVLDSTYSGLSKVLRADTTSGGSFSQMLPTTFQAAVEYALDAGNQHNVSMGFVGMTPYTGKFHYAVSAGYSYRTVSETWQFMPNYTYKSNNPVSVGLGVVMTTGVFQLYLATDNIVPYFGLANARGTTVSLGLNFMFGRTY